jgi:hypothetical protein
MKACCLASGFVLSLTVGVLGHGQTTVVVNDPTKKAVETKWSKAEEEIFNDEVRPKVRRMVSEDLCNESVEIAGVARGAFSKAGAKQTLIFYQYCQTGNGFGWVGLVLINGGRLEGNYIFDGGWSVDIATVSDINQNGLDEFTLAYSGGMHQGQGGVGVDLMEYSMGKPVGIGWYKAEEFDDTNVSYVWKLTAKPGKTPVFYRQKYASSQNNKWRRVGTNSAFKLRKAFSKFTSVK